MVQMFVHLDGEGGGRKGCKCIVKPDMKQQRSKWWLWTQTETLLMSASCNKQIKGNSFSLVEWAIITTSKGLTSIDKAELLYYNNCFCFKVV